MNAHQFTVVVHTSADRLEARMAIMRLLNETPAEIWPDILNPLKGDEAYITLEN